MPQSLFAIGFFVMMAIVVVNFVCAFQLFSILKTRHHPVWIRLGQPSLILNNSIGNNFRLMRFLFRREYLEIEDPGLVKRCNFMLIVQIGGIAWFATIFIAGNVFGVAK